MHVLLEGKSVLRFLPEGLGRPAEALFELHALLLRHGREVHSCPRNRSDIGGPQRELSGVAVTTTLPRAGTSKLPLQILFTMLKRANGPSVG